MIDLAAHQEHAEIDDHVWGRPYATYLVRKSAKSSTPEEIHDSRPVVADTFLLLGTSTNSEPGR